MKKKHYFIICTIIILILILSYLSYSVYTPFQDDKRKPDKIDLDLKIHNENGNSYSTIQEAIYDAAPGDILRISNGEYNEEIIIDREITLIGEAQSNTIIIGSNNNVISINMDSVIVKNLTIKNNGNGYCGIKLKGLSSNSIMECIISNNKFINNGYGIYLDYANENIIEDNIFESHDISAIYLRSSSNNFLMNNIINSNNGSAVNLDSSNDNVISNNSLNSNINYGMLLQYSFKNTISYNNFSLNKCGIFLESSSENILSNNIIDSNKHDGITLVSSSMNTVKDNIVSNNLKNGISIRLSNKKNPNYNSETNETLFGKTYYISVTGDNNANGLTEVTAWQTVTYALTKIESGDTLYIKSGNYFSEKENLIKKEISGTKDNPTRIIGYHSTPGDNPSDRYKMPIFENRGGDSTNCFEFSKASYVELKHFYMTDYYDGVKVEGDCDHIFLDHICVENSIYSGIKFWGEYGICSNHWIYNADSVGFSLSGAYNIVANGNTIEDFQVTDYLFQVQYAQHNTVLNCHSECLDMAPHSRGFCVRGKESHNNIFVNCTTKNTGSMGLAYLETYNNKFINCSGENTLGYGVGYWQASGAHDNEFIGCFAINCSSGIKMDDQESEGACYNGLWEGCTFVNCRTGVQITKGNNNLITNCIFDANSAGGTQSFYLINDNQIGNNIKNSIIINYNYGESVWKSVSSGNSYLMVTYCNFYNNDFSMLSGTGNINKDPLFINPIGFDYHLKSMYGRWTGSDWVKDQITSPCIDTGDPNDNYCRESQPNGGRINIGIYGFTEKASKSSKNGKYGNIDGSRSNVISNNDIEKNNNGIILSSSISNKIIKNEIATYNHNSSGIKLLDSANGNIIESDIIENHGEEGKGILSDSSADNEILGCRIQILGANAFGICVQNYSIKIVNSSITSKSGLGNYDITSISYGNVTAVNCSFQTILLNKNGGGVLTIKNFLSIQVLLEDGIDPLSLVDVEVINNNEIIYATSGYSGMNPKTDNNGMVKNIMVTVQLYYYSNNPIEFTTDIRVKKVIEDSIWEEVREEININNSHLEVFVVS